MNYSSTVKAHVIYPVRFQETQHEHVFQLTGSPRGNVFLDARQRKATPQILRKRVQGKGFMPTAAKRYGISL